MLLNKIFIALAILAGVVLIIENAIISNGAYFFLEYMNTGVVLLLTLIIGGFLGYGLKGLTRSGRNLEEEEYNDY